MPYILPIITVIAVLFAFSGQSGITGFIAAPPAGGEVSADIRVAAPDGQVIPAGSVVTVRITGTADAGKQVDRTASMQMGEPLSSMRFR